MVSRNNEAVIIDLEDVEDHGVLKAVDKGYSSDQSLPDLPIIRTSNPSFVISKRGAQRKTANILMGSSMHNEVQSIVIDDDISVPSPQVSGDRQIFVRNKPDKQAVIDIFSSSQGSEQERHEQNYLDLISQPLKKSQSISLPIEDVNNASTAAPELSSKLLDKLDNLLNRKRKSCTDSHADCHNTSSRDSLDLDNKSPVDEASSVSTGIKDQPPPKKKKFSSSSTSMLEKAQKQLEKQAAKQIKAQEKERKLAEKRIAQSIAAVNVLKKSKKDSTPEMIVEAIGCDFKLEKLPVTGLVRLKRKINARYDAEKGYWIPLANPVVEDEDRLIVILKAQDYLQIIRTTVGLQHHVTSVKRIRPSATILYIIEGLASIVRKSKTMKNRAYQAAVRASGITTADRTATRPAVDHSTQLVDEEIVEDSLLDLQIQHGCLIVHSTSPADTAEHLSVLVSDISTIPYKSDRGRTAQFCTESGQIKTGTDDRDTFEKLLQSISRVTPQISQAIASRFENINALRAALAVNGTKCLENIPKGHNADGTVSNTVLGTATAQKVFRAFMMEDPFAEA